MTKLYKILIPMVLLGTIAMQSAEYDWALTGQHEPDYGERLPDAEPPYIHDPLPIGLLSEQEKKNATHLLDTLHRYSQFLSGKSYDFSMKPADYRKFFIQALHTFIKEGETINPNAEMIIKHALHEAILQNNTDVTKILLQVHNIKPNDCSFSSPYNDYADLGPLHMAMDHNNTAMLQALLKAGVNPDKNYGFPYETAVDYAIRDKKNSMLKILQTYSTNSDIEEYLNNFPASSSSSTSSAAAAGGGSIDIHPDLLCSVQNTIQNNGALHNEEVQKKLTEWEHHEMEVRKQRGLPPTHYNSSM